MLWPGDDSEADGSNCIRNKQKSLGISCNCLTHSILELAQRLINLVSVQWDWGGCGVVLDLMWPEEGHKSALSQAVTDHWHAQSLSNMSYIAEKLLKRTLNPNPPPNVDTSTGKYLFEHQIVSNTMQNIWWLLGQSSYKSRAFNLYMYIAAKY